MIVLRGEDGAIRLVNSDATITSRERNDGGVEIYLALHLPGEDVTYPLVVVQDQTAAEFIKDQIMDALGEGTTVIEVHSSGVDTWKKE